MLMTLSQAKRVRTLQLCGKYVTPYLLAEAIAVIRASVKTKKNPQIQGQATAPSGE